MSTVEERPGSSLEEVSERLALTDAEKRGLVLNMLERFVPHAESFFRPSDLTQPRTGRYAATGSGVTQPRGAGNIAFAYVTLLAARPDQPSFGGISREVLIDHTIQSIRHEALTNTLSGAGYDRWGNGSWQASLETFSWAFAARRLWTHLDEETRSLVQRVLTGEANILLTKPLASGEEGDTGAEDNAWNAPTPALASILFPDHANRAAWESAAIRLALNASSRSADLQSDELVDGRPLREWIGSVNLHPDLTLENHGFFNPIYQQGTHVEIGDVAIAYRLEGRAVPEAISFRTEAIWTEVLGRLAQSDGDLAMTAGQDWTSKDYQHLDYLGILATRFRRADASVLESRALELVFRRQNAHVTGSLLGQPEIGYETMLVKRLAALYWNHELFGPSPATTREEFEAARAETSGIAEYPYSDFIAGRLERAFASMSWDRARPMALLIPDGEAHLGDPVFSYYAPQNLVGSASGTVGVHRCECERDRFSTAGTIGARRFSMTAFPDGTALLLDRGEGSTFTYAIEDIPGVTGERPIWSEAGNVLGTLTGNWINADDRLGMIVRGGGGMSAAAVQGSNRQILITGSSGTGTGERGALLLPLADAATTAALEPFVTAPAVPSDWSALSARAADGTLRLAVARWGGPLAAPVEVSDPRGAPVLDGEVTLVGSRATLAVRLDAPASTGRSARYFVATSAPVRARKAGDAAIVLSNPSSQRTAVSVTDGLSGADALRRLLAAGERTEGRLVGGALTLAGPELEPLLSARDLLARLLAELPSGCRPGRHSPRHGSHAACRARTALIEAARSALGALELALAEARAFDPRIERVTAATDAASHALDELGRRARARDVPASWRAHVRAAADAARAELSRATTAFVLAVWAEPVGTARPGEPLTVRVSLFNRGTSTAHGGRVTVSGPSGWPSAILARAFTTLRSGESRIVTVSLRTPAEAVPGTLASLAVRADYVTENAHREQEAEADVFVAPIIGLAADVARVRLAAGGVNRVPIRLQNHADRELGVSLSARAPDGARAELAEPVIALPPRGTREVLIDLRGIARTSGTGFLEVSGVTPAGASVSGRVALLFTDDLALNDVGAPWPKASATSNQPPYPPALAFDGDNATFWVSDGTQAGQGPSPADPRYLQVDFGLATRVTSVTMVPRVNFGPRGYSVEISEDGVAWTEVANEPSSPNATVTSNFAPILARLVRLRIIGGYDRIQPPRNVQVAELQVRAPAAP